MTKDHAALSLNYAFNNHTACMAELVRKFAQAQSLLTDPKAMELHKLCLLQFDCNPRPESVEIVGLPAGRRGNRDDRVDRQIEGTNNGFHGSADRPRLRARAPGDVIGRSPFCCRTQFVDMCQRQKKTIRTGAGGGATVSAMSRFRAVQTSSSESANRPA